MDNDQSNMALCAIRYTIGRQTYVTADGQRWAIEYGSKSEWLRRILIRDIENAARDQGGLGMDLDARGWLDVLSKLKALETEDLQYD